MYSYKQGSCVIKYSLKGEAGVQALFKSILQISASAPQVDNIILLNKISTKNDRLSFLAKDKSNDVLYIIKIFKIWDCCEQQKKKLISAFSTMNNQEGILLPLIISISDCFASFLYPYFRQGSIYNLIYNLNFEREKFSIFQISEISKKMLKIIQSAHFDNKILMCISLENILIDNSRNLVLKTITSSKIRYLISGSDTLELEINDALCPPELLEELPLGPGADFWQLGILLLA